MHKGPIWQVVEQGKGDERRFVVQHAIYRKTAIFNGEPAEFLHRVVAQDLANRLNA